LAVPDVSGGFVVVTQKIGGGVGKRRKVGKAERAERAETAERAARERTVIPRERERPRDPGDATTVQSP
jgi:hypothetical protein